MAAAAAAVIPRGSRLDVLKRQFEVELERVPLVLGGRVLAVVRALVPQHGSAAAACRLFRCGRVGRD